MPTLAKKYSVVQDGSLECTFNGGFMYDSHVLAVPLVLALVALLAQTVRRFLNSPHELPDEQTEIEPIEASPVYGDFHSIAKRRMTHDA